MRGGEQEVGTGVVEQGTKHFILHFRGAWDAGPKELGSQTGAARGSVQTATTCPGTSWTDL